MRLVINLRTAILACTLFSSVLAHAQSKDPGVPAQLPPPKLDPKACAENQGRAPADETLSEKLARTDGVICPPPGLDADIRVPAPGGGVIEVIPPPGSSGGDPNVRPK